MSNPQQELRATIVRASSEGFHAHPPEQLRCKIKSLVDLYPGAIVSAADPVAQTALPCLICTEDMVLRDDIVQHNLNFDGQNPCRSFFHHQCLKEWIFFQLINDRTEERPVSCPGCRQPLRDENASLPAESSLSSVIIGEDVTPSHFEHHVLENLDEITNLILPFNLHSMEQARRAIRQWLRPQGADFLSEGFLINKNDPDIVSARYLHSLDDCWLDSNDWNVVWFWKTLLGVEHYRRLLVSFHAFGIMLSFYVPHVVEIQFYTALEHLEPVIGQAQYSNLVENGVKHVQIPWNHRVMRRILDTVNFYGHVSLQAIEAFETYARANPNGRWTLYSIPQGHNSVSIFAVPSPRVEDAKLRQSRSPFIPDFIDNGWFPVDFTASKRRLGPSCHEALFHDMPRVAWKGFVELLPDMDLGAEVGPLALTESNFQLLAHILRAPAVTYNRRDFEAELSRRVDIGRLRARTRKADTFLNDPHGLRDRCDIHGNRMDADGQITTWRTLRAVTRTWPMRD